MVSATPALSANTVVFVDTSVPGYQQIAASVPAGDTVVLIDGSQDGVAQISDYLSKASNVGAIHIVSHGADDELDIGTSSVTGDTLGHYASQIAAWKTALAPGADILLYGCSIAADGAGQQFVDSLAGLTGATVAASSDNTGAAASGGNWNLEFSTGKVAVPTLNVPGYDGLLTHFRASSLTWTPLSGNTVQFAMQVSYRESGYSAGLYTDVNGKTLSSAPTVGQIIRVELGNLGAVPGELNFGDGTATPYFVKVTAISTSQDYFVGDMVDKTGAPITHTYASSGPFTASFEDAARLSTLSNFAGDDFRSQTVVDPGTGNSPPVSSLPPIVQLAAGKSDSFQIPAVDPNGDRLVYSIGTASQFISSQPSELSAQGLTASTPIAPKGVTLSSSGLLSWNLAGNTTVKAGQQYVMTVNVSDLDSTGKVKSTTPLDFILQIVDTTTNTPPSFTIVPPAQTVIAGIAAPEQELVATDPQGGLFNVQALNPIAGMTTVYHGDEGELHVDITPTAGEIGTSSIVNFQAIDNLGLTTQTSVTYTVISPAPTLAGAAQQTLEAGQSVVIGTATAAQAGDVLSVTAAGAADGTVSLVPTTSGSNTYNVVYTAKSGAPLSGTDTVTYKVTDTTLASQIVAGSGVSASTAATATVTLDPGATINALTPGVVQNGQTTVVGTVTPGLAGDMLTLTQAAGAQGTLTLGVADPTTGARQVIYTPPATIAASAVDAVSYTVTDQLGGTVSGSSSVEIDAGPSLTFSRIAGDGIVNAQEAAAGVVLSGTTTNVADGQAVTLQILDSGGKLIDTVSTPVMSNAYATGYPKADLVDGTYTVVASVTDQFGIAASSTTQPLTIDTVTTESAIADAAVATGSDGNPYINASRFNGGATTLTGKAEAGDTVAVSVNGAPAQSATVGTDGIWSYRLAGLTDGQSYTATATATDTAGNTAASAPFAFTVDTTVSTPTVSFAGSNSAAGAADVNAAHAKAAGFTVTGVDPDASATVAFTGVSKTTGKSTTVTAAATAGTVDLSGFVDGTVTTSVTATDAAGNTATGTGPSALLDTTVSTPTVSFAAANSAANSAAGAADVNAAHAKAAGFTVTGVDPDASATVAFTGVSKTTGKSTTVTAAATAGTFDLSGFVDGTVTTSVTATDAAGNTATGTGPSVLLDTTVSTPTVSFAAANSAAGAADVNAAHAKAAGFTVTGVDPDASATVAFTGVSKTTGKSTTVTVAATAGTFDLSGFVDGTISAIATATDQAGNAATSKAATTVLDTAPPVAVPGIRTVGHNTVNDVTQLVNGLVTPAHAGDTETITGLSAASGKASVDPGTGKLTYTAAGAGSDTLTFTVQDQVGNTATGTVAVTVDGGPTLTAINATAKLGQSVNLTGAILAAATPGLKGDLLAITADNTAGTAGTVSLVNGALTYTASGAGLFHIPANGAQADSFTYTVSDQYGDTATATAKITVTNPATVINGPCFGFGNVQGTTGTDIINAYGFFNTIASNGGNDVINAGLGNAAVNTASGDVVTNLQGYFDSVTGGDGWNTVSGSAGNATVTLGNGNDSVSVGGYSNTIKLGNGTNTVVAGQGNACVTSGSGKNSVTLAGYSNGVTLGDGDDVVKGGDGLATVTLGNGNSKVTLGGWSNTIKVGSGNNTIVAGAGLANVTAGAGTEIITLAGTGNSVTLNGSKATVSGGQGGDVVTVNGGTDALTLAGWGDAVNVNGAANVSITDLANALRINVGSSTQTDTITGFFSKDSSGLVDLLNGAGGYKSAGDVLKNLTSDGHGGTMLALGTTGSIDFVNTNKSQFQASNFRVG